MSEFDRLKINDNDSVNDFSGNTSGLSYKTASLRENVKNPKMKKFLIGLPRYKFIQIISSLEPQHLKSLYPRPSLSTPKSQNQAF